MAIRGPQDQDQDFASARLEAILRLISPETGKAAILWATSIAGNARQDSNLPHCLRFSELGGVAAA